MYDLTLLYVEDDPRARTHYAAGLRQLIRQVVETGSVAEALHAYDDTAPQLLLVDLSLPDGDGLALIERLRRERSEALIIILSAHSQKTQLLKAIELGVFRYFIKPAASSELIDAIHQAARKALDRADTAICLNSENALYWNKEGYFLNRADGKTVPLSTYEQRLLEILHAHQGCVVTVEDIQYYVWPEEPPMTQALRNLVARLRKKVPGLNIKSQYGTGYILNIA